MQGAWWYLVGDSPRGPVSMEVLEVMLFHGHMTPQSLIWREGLSCWISVAELAALRETGTVQTEPAPPLARLAPAGAWRRFWARMVDLWIIGMPTALLGWLLLAQVQIQVPGFAHWLQRPSSTLLLALCVLPLTMALEAGVFAFFGTTPGKSLLGVEVMTLDGQPLTPTQYLRRQLGVFWFGFALGLPIISLIAMVSHGLSLQMGEPTPYDVNRFTVRARRLGRTRVLVLTGIGCIMAGLGFAKGYLGY
ncbi:MAG: RDD family protein [Comamonas sp.]